MNPVPDIITTDLKILFIGFNPGERSALTGYHFAGHSNRFWKLLALSGLTPCQLRPEQDRLLLSYGYGISNIVARPSKTAAEITKDEYKEGRTILLDKLQRYQPKIACYVGIGVYKEFAQRSVVKCGIQDRNIIPKITDFIVPSPSGLNRIKLDDQLSYYQQLYGLVFC
ncbi:mismatch-specific DNA-glycosylase [Dendrosporobacter sp. 1207_IL3150]|uniref:mismatch-specific DNA-glycosylase n=1 Tax=Dendrosporobacter sp. 1207_IL3150 TaxID=3084054 RepID=UPI002FD99D14